MRRGPGLRRVAASLADTTGHVQDVGTAPRAVKWFKDHRMPAKPLDILFARTVNDCKVFIREHRADDFWPDMRLRSQLPRLYSITRPHRMAAVHFYVTSGYLGPRSAS